MGTELQTKEKDKGDVKLNSISCLLVAFAACIFIIGLITYHILSNIHYLKNTH